MNAKLTLSRFFLSTILLACVGQVSFAAEGLQSQGVQKIWSGPKHDAFTDLIRYKGDLYCTFRESEHHVGGDGQIRILRSAKGEKWEPAAVITEPGIDLRDPKFSINPKNELMLTMGGSVYEGKKLLERQPRVSFSSDGKTWTQPKRVLKKGEWLWRVTWHEGKAYGISYNSSVAPDWIATLVSSSDGLDWVPVTTLAVNGKPNEATVRFRKNGECVALIRRESEDKQAWIGVSSAPYKDWSWKSCGMQVGGPNFILLPDGRSLASGRKYGVAGEVARTFVGWMDRDRVVPEVILPSGGDTSYAGMVYEKNTLLLSYYSSHEKNTDIYFARITVPAEK